MGKTSTVKQLPKKIETPKNRLPKIETELSDHEIEHLTSLDLDLDLDSEEEESPNELSGVVKKTPMKLSSILPKPSPKSSKSTPASSSKKGLSKPAPKLTEKRKRLEDATAAAAAANKGAKKMKLGSEEESQEAEQMRPFKCETCNARFFRQEHLTRHEKQHTGTQQFPCKMCGKSFPSKEKFKLHAKVHMNGKDSQEDSDAASAITSGEKGKLLVKINISSQEKDLANMQLTPQQLAHKVLAEKQLEKVAKTSQLVQSPRRGRPPLVNQSQSETLTPRRGRPPLVISQSQSETTPRRGRPPLVYPPQSETITPKGSQQITKTPKQVETTPKTPSNNDQEAKASGPDFIKGTSQSGRIRKVKKIFDL